MKYNININQLVLQKSNLNLIDCALLDYLWFFCHSQNQKIKNQRLTDQDKNQWTWIDYGKIIEDMPLLGIKTTHSLTPRVQNLEKNGFIKTMIWKGKRKYMRLLQKTENIYISSESEIVEKISRNRIDDTIRDDVSVVGDVSDSNVGNDGVIHYPRKLNYTPADKLCTAQDTKKGCGHCPYCSWTVCSSDQLYQLALEKEVPFEDIKQTYETLITWIESGRMKDLTVYRTLVNWINRDIRNGSIRQLDYMGLEMMKLKFDTKLRSKLEAIHEKLEKGEI